MGDMVLRVPTGPIQELLGHKDVSTTMMYTHVLNEGGMVLTARRIGCDPERWCMSLDILRADIGIDCEIGSIFQSKGRLTKSR